MTTQPTRLEVRANMTDRNIVDVLDHFIRTWEWHGVGDNVATLQDGPDTSVTIRIDDLRAALAAMFSESKPAEQEPIGWVGLNNYWTQDAKIAERMGNLTPVYLDPDAPAQSAEPVKIYSLWSSGGCTGYNDYLMTDYSIRGMKASEVKRGQTFPPNDGSYETVSRDNPYAAKLTAYLSSAPQPSPTAVVLDERAASAPEEK